MLSIYGLEKSQYSHRLVKSVTPGDYERGTIFQKYFFVNIRTGHTINILSCSV